MNTRSVTLTFAGIGSAACALIAQAADFSFAPPIAYQLPPSHAPLAIRLGDLNGDGKIDAVVPGRNWNYQPGSSSTVAVLRGNGDGTFTAWPSILVLEGSSEDAAIADVDGDGKKDVVITASGPHGRLAFARGHGDGTFDPVVFKADFERSPHGLTVGDLDNDGDVDVAVLNYVSASTQVVRNDLPGGGNLGLVATKRMGQYLGAIPYPQQITAADFDGDGRRDLLTTMIGGSRIGLTHFDGTNLREVDWKPAPIANEQPAVINASVFDIDGDGDLDVALPCLMITQSQKVVVFRNDGHGAMTQQSVFDTGFYFYSWCTTPIDVDGDGRRDLAIGTALTGLVAFMRNETAGPTAPLALTAQPVILPYGLFVRDLASADVDNDGDQDLVGVEIAGGTVFTMLNQTQQGGGVASDMGAKRPARPPAPPAILKQHPPMWVNVDVNGDGAVNAIDVALSLEQMALPTRGGAR
ncbi:MAG: VCBS repeat-containing protein [Phycisphaerales bacterium]